MKILSRSSNKCFFIRNELEQAIHYNQRISRIKISKFAEDFFHLYSECNCDHTASIIMMTVEEQMEILKTFIAKYNYGRHEIVSLDKFNYIGSYWLNVSRIFNLVGDTYKNSKIIYLDGLESLHSSPHQNLKKLLIVDDDICTGGTIKNIISTFDQQLLFPNADITTVGIANICCEKYELIDCIDLRDFVHHTLFGGLVVQKQATLTRVCYLDDNVDLYQQASIHPNKVSFFIKETKKLLQALYN